MELASKIANLIGNMRTSKKVLQLAENGFDTLRDSVVTYHVLWSDIQKVVAFKRDELITDLVCFELSLSRQEGPFTLLIHEELEGFDQVVEHMASLLEFNDWREKIILPPLATSVTQLFPRIEIERPPSQPSPSGGGRG